MTWLLVILSVLLFIALLGALPVGVIIDYNRELRIKLKIFTFVINLYSSRQNKKTAALIPKVNKKKKSRKSKNKNFFEKVIKEKGIIGFIKLIFRLFSESSKVFKRFLSRININKINVIICTGGRDAAETAYNYGKICSAVYPLAGLITSLIKPKNYSINIAPDFSSEKTIYIFYLDISSRVFYICGALFSLVKKYSELM